MGKQCGFPTNRRNAFHDALSCRPSHTLALRICHSFQIYNFNPIYTRVSHIIKVMPGGSSQDPPSVLLPDDASRLARLLAGFAPFYHKPVELEELADYCLPLLQSQLDARQSQR